MEQEVQMHIAPGIRERWDEIPEDKRVPVFFALTAKEQFRLMNSLSPEENARLWSRIPLMEQLRLMKIFSRFEAKVSTFDQILLKK